MEGMEREGRERGGEEERIREGEGRKRVEGKRGKSGWREEGEKLA